MQYRRSIDSHARVMWFFHWMTLNSFLLLLLARLARLKHAAALSGERSITVSCAGCARTRIDIFASCLRRTSCIRMPAIRRPVKIVASNPWIQNDQVSPLRSASKPFLPGNQNRPRYGLAACQGCSDASRESRATILALKLSSRTMQLDPRFRPSHLLCPFLSGVSRTKPQLW